MRQKTRSCVGWLRCVFFCQCQRSSSCSQSALTWFNCSDSELAPKQQLIQQLQKRPRVTWNTNQKHVNLPAVISTSNLEVLPHQVLVVGLHLVAFLHLNVQLIAGVFQLHFQSGFGHVRLHQQLFVLLQLQLGVQPLLSDLLEVFHQLDCLWESRPIKSV